MLPCHVEEVWPLTNRKSPELVFTDSRLIFHFCHGTPDLWRGHGEAYDNLIIANIRTYTRWDAPPRSCLKTVGITPIFRKSRPIPGVIKVSRLTNTNVRSDDAQIINRLLTRKAPENQGSIGT